MKFSFCLPIALNANDFRRAEMLVDCLKTILVQTHQDYEVILKDAFPKQPITAHKNVADIMEQFDSRMNYVAMADKGIFPGLNQALKHATGDILHFICGDDLFGVPNTLSFLNEQFSIREEGPAWIYGSLGTILADDSEGHWGITPFATLQELLIHNRMGQPAVFWNRAMFEKIGYFEYTRAGDYDYWCRCYRVCPPMYTTRLLAVGRRWNESASYIDRDIVEKEASEISAKHTKAHLDGELVGFSPYSHLQ